MRCWIFLSAWDWQKTFNATNAFLVRYDSSWQTFGHKSYMYIFFSPKLERHANKRCSFNWTMDRVWRVERDWTWELKFPTYDGQYLPYNNSLHWMKTSVYDHLEFYKVQSLFWNRVQKPWQERCLSHGKCCRYKGSHVE